MKDILDKIDLIQKHVNDLQAMIAARERPAFQALGGSLKAEIEAVQRAEAARITDGPNSAIDVHNGEQETLKVLADIMPEASPPPSSNHATPTSLPPGKEGTIGMLHGAPTGFDNAQPANSMSVWGGGKR